jgi:hypothetical protein
MTRDEFLQLPENIRRCNADLAGCDSAMMQIAAYTPLSPRTFLRQIDQLQNLVDWKNSLLAMGATQEGADFVKESLKCTA